MKYLRYKTGDVTDTDGMHLVHDDRYGLSIREYMATQILQGILSNPSFAADSRMATKMAVTYADHLIEELNEYDDE